MATLIDLIIGASFIATFGMAVVLNIITTRRLAKLQLEFEKVKKLERLYGKMALEIRNIADANAIGDAAGVAVFYNKLLALHNEFMSVE